MADPRASRAVTLAVAVLLLELPAFAAGFRRPFWSWARCAPGIPMILSPSGVRLDPASHLALRGIPDLRAPASSTPLPFVVLHGIGDACANPGMLSFLALLSRLSGGANGTCIEIGDGFRDSWLMRLDRQTATVCSKILEQEHLKGGFNMLGLSQGGLIARAVIQTCEALPKVHNLVSVGGPQAGVASTPNCVYSTVCRLIDAILRLGIYSEIAQNNVAPAGYVKIPTMLDTYLLHAKFLPYINNEVKEKRNKTYWDRFKGLNRLALIKFQEDTVLFPPETAHFEFFAANTFENPIPLKESELYLEDWIGLRELDTEGRVDYITFPGNHLHLPLHLINTSIVPYLDGRTSANRRSKLC